MGAGKPPRVAEPAPDGECVMKSVRLLGAVIVTALSILTGACGANTPTAPTQDSPATQPPTDQPPAQVSQAQIAWNVLPQEVKDYLLLPGNLGEMADGSRSIRRAAGERKFWTDPAVGSNLTVELGSWHEAIPNLTLTVVTSRVEADTILQYSVKVNANGRCAWMESADVKGFTFFGASVVLAFGAAECRNIDKPMVTAHEVGHTIGLIKHTPESWQDIMSEKNPTFRMSQNLGMAIGFMWSFPPGTTIKP
ncbi:hypothetical protein A3H56_01740 [Candidatus Nomurabacteria bacterium RIFCSPLOWO2_02_FULL_42_24]|nr:MAG: hypothetical protein A3F49_03520 [Candidatus Nomurabacteria bacterium RIFCSPHIGHO2_12_FULL_42_19]OGI97971.1 MAG: hypothetical protein A3H56_01740 [Candidatus Nomurabacteria bacterium RIFCSPLOWO2_02_FULL_42_24]